MQAEYDDIEALLTEQLGVLEDAIACQAAWLSLSAILQEPSSRSLIADQIDAATEVQMRWRLMQMQLQDGKDHLLEACEHGGALASCTATLALIRIIFAHCGQLYTTMRATFPRLHLVSDDECALALANSHSPADVPVSLLSTCFPGVVALVATPAPAAQDEHVVITTVQGRRGDAITLIDTVAAGLAPLHEWLVHLEVALKCSLRSHTRSCLSSAATLDDTLWLSNFPQQAVMIVDSLAFVDATERALLHISDGTNPAALRSFAELTAVRLATLGQGMSKCSADAVVSKSQICTFEVLLLMGQAHRDSAEVLVREGAAALSDWAWLRQVRHYWGADTSDCHICIGDVRIAYGWEYSGGASCSELLLLVQSDRVMLAACMALKHTGVLAMCPVAESVGMPLMHFAEALAGTFGRLLVQMDCTASISFVELVRTLQVCPFVVLHLRVRPTPHEQQLVHLHCLLWPPTLLCGSRQCDRVQGVLAMGAWGWMDGIDSLGAHKLSFLSELIGQVQHGIASRAPSVVLANIEVPLDHEPSFQDADALPFALLLGMPPPSIANCIPPARSRALSDFLRERARRVAVRPANLGVILEAALRSGFHSSLHALLMPLHGILYRPIHPCCGT
jgi:hypothetical protein